MATDGARAVFIRDGRQWSRLPVSEILFLEADDNSTTVHTTLRAYIVPRMLKDVMAELLDEQLVRVHRCHAVNLGRVQAVSENGLHVGGRWLPIGRSYRTEVLTRLRLI